MLIFEDLKRFSHPLIFKNNDLVLSFLKLYLIIEIVSSHLLKRMARMDTS